MESEELLVRSRRKSEGRRIRFEQAPEQNNAFATKVCPRCGERLYTDMGICFGCLYDYTCADEYARTSRAVSEVEEDAHEKRELASLPLPVELTDLEEPEPDEPVAPTEPDDALDLCEYIAPEHTGAWDPGIYVRSPAMDVWVAVGERGLVVGRDPSCDVVLHSPTVSLRHLSLVPFQDGMEVTDLGATNPATIRGDALVGSEYITWGETINVCGFLLTLTSPSSL